MQVILTAIFFSLVIKNPGGDEDEDNDEDEEKPPLAADEEYLHDIDSGNALSAEKVNRLEKILTDRAKWQ